MDLSYPQCLQKKIYVCQHTIITICMSASTIILQQETIGHGFRWDLAYHLWYAFLPLLWAQMITFKIQFIWSTILYLIYNFTKVLCTICRHSKFRNHINMSQMCIALLKKVSTHAKRVNYFFPTIKQWLNSLSRHSLLMSCLQKNSIFVKYKCSIIENQCLFSSTGSSTPLKQNPFSAYAFLFFLL